MEAVLPASAAFTNAPNRRRAALQWVGLLAASVVGVGLFRLVHVPAALLLGPMAAGIALAAWGGTIAVPRVPFLMAQGVIGGLIASRFTPSVIDSMAHAWKLGLLVTFGVLVASTTLGCALASWRILPGTTAVWGSSPGAATSMVVMAEEFGADGRLVAFMQYLRVVLVAVVASAVAHVVVPRAGDLAAPPFFGAIHGARFAFSLALVFGGAAIGAGLRIPAGALLVPFALGSALNLCGWLSPELPPWLLALSYALVGWTVGLRFTRPILIHVARALPSVLASIVVLIGVCGLMAVALTRFAGIDPLTAYLATSPGGVDSAAIIAASSGKADALFVMTLQMMRAITVLFIGPSLAKFVARRVGDRSQMT